MARISTFRALYDSDCAAMISSVCDGDIVEGDDAGYVDDEVACGACVEAAQQANEDVVAQSGTTDFSALLQRSEEE